MSLDDFIISPAEQLRRARERRARMYAPPKPAHNPEPAVIEDVPDPEPEAPYQWKPPEVKPVPFGLALRLMMPAVPGAVLEAGTIRTKMSVILEVVSRAYEIERSIIISASRRKKHVWARHVAMWVARHITELSTPQIGRALGHRDHTTVLHGVDRIERLRRSSHDIHEEVMQIVAAVHVELGDKRNNASPDSSFRWDVYNEDGPRRCA